MIFHEFLDNCYSDHFLNTLRIQYASKTFVWMHCIRELYCRGTAWPKINWIFFFFFCNVCSSLLERSNYIQRSVRIVVCRVVGPLIRNFTALYTIRIDVNNFRRLFLKIFWKENVCRFVWLDGCWVDGNFYRVFC